MSTGDPPGFFTTLPLVALLGLSGSSVLVAYCIRALSSRFDTRLDFPRGGLVLTCVVAQLLILFTTVIALVSIGGIPLGPLFGPPLPTLFVVYGFPLMVISLLLGRVLDWRGQGGVTPRFWGLSSVTFAVVHVLTIPVVWLAFVLVD